MRPRRLAWRLRLCLQASPIHLPHPIEHTVGNERKNHHERHCSHGLSLLSRPSPRLIFPNWSRAASSVDYAPLRRKALPSLSGHTLSPPAQARWKIDPGFQGSPRIGNSQRSSPIRPATRHARTRNNPMTPKTGLMLTVPASR